MYYLYYMYVYLMVLHLMCHRYMSESKAVHPVKYKTILNIFWISHLC